MMLIIVALMVAALMAVFAMYRHEGYAMVIVEPRKHPLLEYVLGNFDAHVPGRYRLYIFHGTENEGFARRASRVVKRRQVDFVKLPVTNLDANGYNALLKTKAFYDRIDAEHILIFQTDAVACGNSHSPFGIDSFERYSYIGCPYASDRIGKGAHWGPTNSFYGVGGLSFRRKSTSLECIRTTATSPDFPEDVFFSNCVEQRGTRPEHGSVLQAFCSQSSANAGSWGVHKPTSMDASNRAKLLKTCPAVAPLLS